MFSHVLMFTYCRQFCKISVCFYAVSTVLTWQAVYTVHHEMDDYVDANKQLDLEAPVFVNILMLAPWHIYI